jgi:alpha-amylase
MTKIRFALVLHNHQPIGNFDGVIEAAYHDSYLPFLETIERYPELPFALHTSGCLLDWLVARQPEYLSRLRRLVERGQLEIVGGGYYEPILPMIPPRDRLGQIRGYTEMLHELFGCKVRGMWVPERVWEQNLVSDICAAGIEYTILDDYHFRAAGLKQEELFGYYLSEDDGRVLKIFPGSEPMRYLIPFQDVERVIDYLRDVHHRHPGALVVFADDGEKFGTWPETKKHVYEQGWIYRFLDALRNNLDWIDVCTPADALDSLEPLGQVALPNCSYREMTEWVLPTDRLLVYEQLWHELDQNPRGGEIKDFFRGGFWRNFKAKYAEAHEMYARMMQVSNALEQVCRDQPHAFSHPLVHEARHELYRGQCNCSYWHGAFGGLYLPHLRNAVYASLIRAENHLLAYQQGTTKPFVKVDMADYNLDARKEVRLENDRIVALFSPRGGGAMYELDLRSTAVNLGASLSRRPEAYHEKVRHAAEFQREGVGSIHDRVVCKQEGLEQRLTYDAYPRKLLLDHFLPAEVDPSALPAGQVAELGDFVTGAYRCALNPGERHAGVTLTRHGTIDGCKATVVKTIGLRCGTSELAVEYRLQDLPPDRPVHFAVEFNFAALAAGADDRYYAEGTGTRLGRLESTLDLPHSDELHLVDEWLGVDVALGLSEPTGIWAFPIQSVSQSEGGFELVHQSACVMPHWLIPAGVGEWRVVISLAIAESRVAAGETEPLAAEVATA